MIHKAKDLSFEQRRAVESLLGRPVSESEAIAIRAYQPDLVSDQRRREIIEVLEAHFAAIDARCQPVSAEEAEAIFEEAMRSSRQDYQTKR